MTEDQEQSTSPPQSPRRRVTGIADVPLIACQSGSMMDGAASSLESFHLLSVEGTANPAYSSASDSDRSASQDDGESAPKRGSQKLTKSPKVYTTRITVNLSPGGVQNQLIHSASEMEAPVSGSGNGTRSIVGVVESEGGSPDLHSSADLVAESSSDAVNQHTSIPIGAKLVVTAPPLSQQNSVRIPTPLPHSCTSVASTACASSYSDSELIPQRNSVLHNVAKMVATEHRVTKQHPEVPQILPSSSVAGSGKQFATSSTKKPLSAEQKKKNRSVVEKRLRHWHLQRSWSAGDNPGNNPASRHPLADDASSGTSRPKTGMRSRHPNRMVSSQQSVPVHGSADLAGVTPDSFLPSSSSLHPFALSTLNPVSAENNSSGITGAGNTHTSENSSTEATTVHLSAKEDNNHDNNQTDADAVFDENSAGNTEESTSAMVIDVLFTEGLDQSASTLVGSTSEHRVPNRAILRRGSGE